LSALDRAKHTKALQIRELWLEQATQKDASDSKKSTDEDRGGT